MRIIDDVHIRRLDATLLLVFETTLRTGKLTEVGRRLGLTQSAVSHAVARLRDIFDDPLFVRRGAGVQPTPKAVALAVPIGRALGALREAVQSGQIFDPRTAERRFVVGALDYVVALVGTELLQVLAETAPGCRITFRTLDRAGTVRALMEGEIDLAVGVFPPPADRFVKTALFEETFSAVVRRGHPALAEGLDLMRYCALDHVLVSVGGEDRGVVDDALADMGLKRRISAVMPQFFAALVAVAGSDAVTTVPTRLATALGDRFGLTPTPPPLPLPPFEVSMLRHGLSSGDPGVDWLAAVLTERLRQA